MGQLPPEQHKRLVELASDAFYKDIPGLEQLAIIKIGVRLFNLVPSNLSDSDTIFRLIQALETRGLLPRFIQAIIEARPERKDIALEFPPMLTALSQPGQAPDVAVTLGLQGVVSHIADQAVRSVVADSRSLIEKLSEDIFALCSYKVLHDALHNLQFQLRRLSQVVRALPTDPNAALDLAECVTEMRTLGVNGRTALDDLPLSPPHVRIVETSWLDRLEAAAVLAETAIQTNDTVPGRQCIQSIKSLLRQEPPRIDRVLVITAGSLQLDQLKDIFQKISAHAAKDSAFVQSVEGGRTAVELLLAQLRSLVEQHTQWQSIDQDLWEAENLMPRDATVDPSDFDALWAGIQKKSGALIALEPRSKGSLKLGDLANNVATARNADAWQKLALPFAQYRHEAILQFFSIDSTLRGLSGKIYKIGSALRTLLQQL